MFDFDELEAQLEETKKESGDESDGSCENELADSESEDEALRNTIRARALRHGRASRPVEVPGSPVSSDTSNDLVALDAGPAHMHRERNQNRFSKQIIWKADDPEEVKKRRELECQTAEVQRKVRVIETQAAIGAGSIDNLEREDAILDIVELVSARPALWPAVDIDDKINSEFAISASREVPPPTEEAGWPKRGGDVIETQDVSTFCTLGSQDANTVTDVAWPWHEVQRRWMPLMTPAAIEAYAAAAVIGEGIKIEIIENVEDLCGDEDILREAKWFTRSDRPVDPWLDALGDEKMPKVHIRKRATQARKVGTRRYRLARGVTVDSGAADNVMPRRILRKKAKLIRPSQASRAGVHYVAANDGRIPNEGEAEFQVETKEGNQHSWTFQIAEVNKVLAAVSALVDAGNKVVFDRDDKTGLDISLIVNKKSGLYTKLRRERNVWVVDAWVEEEDDDDLNNVDRPAKPDAVFARQG